MKNVTVSLLDEREDVLAIQLGYKYRITGDELCWFATDADLAWMLEEILTGGLIDVAQ